MNLEKKTKAEIMELLKIEEIVLAYEKVKKHGVKEIRLIEIDGKLNGIIFSPNVMQFDLSEFNGVFNIRTDNFKIINQ